MRKLDEDDASSPKSIKLTAHDKLELTITRTCLDVLTQLGEAFGNAVALTSQTDGVVQQSNSASYLVRNDIGFHAILLLADSSLQVIFFPIFISNSQQKKNSRPLLLNRKENW